MAGLFNQVVLGSLLLLGWSEGQRGGDAQQVGNAAAEPTQPPAIQLAGWVTDAADILSPVQENRITSKLQQLERTTGHQFVIATVPSLDGREIAKFTLDLANSWGIGRRGVNDGIVLLIAPNERKARIEVGRGLEQVLPNSLCQEILENEITSKAQRGDLPGGIEAGVDALIARLR